MTCSSATSTRSGRIIPPAFLRSGAPTPKVPTPATAGYGLASFLLGVPDSGQFTIGPSLALLQTSYNWYLNDDWKLSRTLTLNLGVRYEYQTPFKERYNQLAY